MTISLMAMTRDGLAETDGIRKEYIAPEIFTFPGGEHHLRNVPEFDEPVTWIALVRGSDPNDLVKAALLSEVAGDRDEDFNLLIPYLPAARADRGIPFGASVYADFINVTEPDRVVTIDAHSHVMPGLVGNIVIADHADLVRAATDQPAGHRYHAVIAPDKGAVERAGATAKHLGLDLYRADKKRDFETGEILGIEMVDDLPKSGHYLVVDDICDGGGTFMGLASAIGLPREQLGLWVTHGIFSGKAHLLREKYLNVYTTDSHPGHGRIDVGATVVPVLPTLLRHVERP